MLGFHYDLKFRVNPCSPGHSHKFILKMLFELVSELDETTTGRYNSFVSCQKRGKVDLYQVVEVGINFNIIS